MAVGIFKSKSSSHFLAQYSNKSKLPTTHNHHHHRRRLRRRLRHRHHSILFQLLLKVFIVARVIFKRLSPGAAEDGAEDVLVVRRHLPATEPKPRLPLGHVRDGHVKDVAQDVAEDVTQDAAEGVQGAAEDRPLSASGGKVVTMPVACP